jgi:NADH-ubiquinone oxidoreductase chain 3
MPYLEKTSTFECGYHSFLGQSRNQFSISFFLVGLFFLIFDLEIVLIYPFSISSYLNEDTGTYIYLIFILVITVGFAFEIGKEALVISSKQLLPIFSDFKDRKTVNLTSGFSLAYCILFFLIIF